MPRKHSPRSNKGAKKGATKTVVISGHQMYIDVINGANGTKLFSAVNYQYVSPDSFGTQIAEHADRFNMYRFKKLVFEFKPTNYNLGSSVSSFSSADSNLFAFGFEADAVQTFTVTFGSISQLKHSIVVPNVGYRNSTENRLYVRNPSAKWYYTKDDLSDNASSRQTISGLLYGECRSSITSSYTWGEIRVSYVVEFKDPCPTQGVTVSGLARELRLGKVAMLRNLLHVVNCTIHAKNREDGSLKAYLEALSNEEFLFVTGHGRTVVPPLSEPDGCDIQAVAKELGKLQVSLFEII